MIELTFIDVSGRTQLVGTKPGISAMVAARVNNVEGILADCGGAMACATCHVYVDAQWQKLTGEPSDEEREMLELAIEPDERSRLSCQITLTNELDGLILHLPREQY